VLVIPLSKTKVNNVIEFIEKFTSDNNL
jgi:hypothetical protein